MLFFINRYMAILKKKTQTLKMGSKCTSIEKLRLDYDLTL